MTTTRLHATYEQAVACILRDLGKQNPTLCGLTRDTLKDMVPFKGAQKISGSKSMIYKGVYKNIRVVSKMFSHDDKSEYLGCLMAEFGIYTYIVPFLVFANITPHVLIPANTGVCTSKTKTTTTTTSYVITPLVEWDMHEMIERDLDMGAVVFQMVYTIAAFAYVGLRHNDLNLINVRIHVHDKPKTTVYRLRDGLLVRCRTIYEALVYDFDRTAVLGRIKEAADAMGLDVHNPCVEPAGLHCTSWNQCDTDVGGRRDLLMLWAHMSRLTDVAFRPVQLNDYMYDMIMQFSPENAEYFGKYVDPGRRVVTTTQHNNKFYNAFVHRPPDSTIHRHIPHVEDVLNDRAFLDACGVSVHPPDKSVTAFEFHGTDIYAEFVGFQKKIIK